MKNYKLKWPFKNEKTFTTAFLKEFKKDKTKGRSFKIPDIWRTIKPFDFIWVHKEWVFFCEVKVIDWNTFNFNKLRDNQYTALRRIDRIRNNFYYLFNIIKPCILVYSKKYDQYKFIDIKAIIDIEKNWFNSIKLWEK